MSGPPAGARDGVPDPLEVPVPAGTRLVADRGLRRLEGGGVVIGGSPLRLFRLSDAGRRVVAGWLAGEPVGAGASGARLARRLVQAGMVHPRPAAGSGPGVTDVTVVIPVRDDPCGLEESLAGLARDPGPRPAAIVVVDDGSVDPVRVATVVAGSGACLVRRPVPGGPAAARNAGMASVTTPLVAFLDAGVRTTTAWLAPLLAQLEDAAVVAVAPRVRSAPGPSLLERFERSRSPLDLGDEGARVLPGTRVPYVPTAALVARRAALVEVGGFDEGLRFGEDVDLVWRLVTSGRGVRYEPASEVVHAPRRTWQAWARQRAGYGSAAGPLSRRHRGALAPVRVSAWSVAAWTLVAARRPVPALVLVVGSTAVVSRKLAVLRRPWPESVRLVGSGHVGAGRLLGAALTRAWWPVAAVGALACRRFRPVVAAAVVVPPVLEWWGQPSAERIDPVRYVALRLGDDIAYGTGLWRGAWRERTVAPLVPDLGSWPGRRGTLRRRWASGRAP